ncbi:BMP family ABC transporter substrate-binding protein [Vineibacter terrae]|uniref:BMP family lipoprotein n=1 Tax=Vineibacter terrae TaxID=2586908 RepID=UPI002E34C6A4|nr:BMP family ABC transporter substrate-binding protein [Vineibacter terrae]HEX2885752.1 BMP family ABC transporter substrate-binding protein [Vineibacter terrae]
MPQRRRYRRSHVLALLTALPLAAASFAAQAADPAPAVVYSVGEKFDGSFNEAAFRGAERFKGETGIAYRDFVVTNEAQLEQAHRRFAQGGSDPIVGVGFLQTSAVTAVAKQFPKVRFTVIDTVVDLPNVRSVLFKEHEGSFLVGVAAALASKSGTIGFVGGMDIPLIRKFVCGYAQGARYAKPGTTVIQNMTGNTPAAWTDPGRGAELAKGQFERGVDVIYAAAGTTGLGVLQAAKDRGKLAIGVDSNQNGVHPGSVLTSMVKRVDLATYETFTAAKAGTWSAGVRVLGLKEGGVDWAVDQNNATLISDAIKAKVEQAKADIVSGKITVHDYMSSNSCPQ